MYYNVCNKHIQLKKPKYHIFFKKLLFSVFLLFSVSVVMNMKKCLKNKSQLKY